MRRLFKFIFQLIAVAIFLFLCLAAVIIFDGLNDQGQKADCALVIGGTGGDQGSAALDRAVKLYSDGEFPVIIVTGRTIDMTTTVDKSTGRGTYDEPVEMTKYLVNHGVPAAAILEVRHDGTMQETAQVVAKTMKSHMLLSVLIVADYYHITRVRLALAHEGIEDIEKSHVGMLRKEDALPIGREVVDLCDYVGHVYLLPAAEKAKDEAKVGLDKASVDAAQARDKVNKSLDNMAK